MNKSPSVQIDESGLVRAAERFVGMKLHAGEWLDGGDEALVLRLDGDADRFVVHVSPPWRTPAELHWVHAVARHAHARVSQAVMAVEQGGRTSFQWEGRVVALFPFVDGATLDRDDPSLRKQAARILARIHTALLDWPGGPRPDHGEFAPRLSSDPDHLTDPDLDEWWARVRDRRLVTGPTHGDYYRRNLLCDAGNIVGVIDWHDAVVRPLAVELAGATFELCRDDEHTLQTDRVEEFVASYGAAGGPVPDPEIGLLLPLMRLWIRNDIRGSLARGGDPSDEYVTKQIRAFRDLADTRLTL